MEIETSTLDKLNQKYLDKYVQEDKKTLNVLFIDDFIKHYQLSLSKNTVKIYAGYLKRIEKGEIIKIKSKTAHRHLSTAIAKAKVIGLEIDYIIPEWNKRKDTRSEYRENRYLNELEFNKMLGYFPQTKKGRECIKACKIAYYSGLRLSEVFSIQAKNIEGNKIRVVGKGQKSRTAYIKREQVSILQGFRKFSITKGSLQTAITRASKRASKQISFHSLRHSFAINFIKASKNIAILQRILGHSSIQTTLIYLKYLDIDSEMEGYGF